MGRVFDASPEQRAAHKASVTRAAGYNRESTKQKFIRDFLEFTGRVSSDGGGAIHKLKKGQVLLLLSGHSDHISLPTDEEPKRGVHLLSHRAVVSKDARDPNNRKELGGAVVTAEVQVGLIVDGTFPKLAGTETVLQVMSMPPAVFFNPDGGRLNRIEPETEAWAQMTELTDTLISREGELVSRFRDN